MNIHSSPWPSLPLAAPGPTRHPAPSATPSCAPPSTSLPRAATSTPRSPTSRAQPASPPAPSISTSAARTTCSSRSSNAPCARRCSKAAQPSPTSATRATRLQQFARMHLARLGRDRNLAIVFQVELRQSTKFMERVFGHAAARLPGPDPDGLCRRPARRPLSGRHQGHRGGQDVLRRARRNGDQLGVERPPLSPRGRRRGRRRSVRQRSESPMTSDAPIRSVAVLGAGTMGAQIAAHFANAGVPALLLDVTADCRPRRPQEGAGAQTGAVLHARRRNAGDHRQPGNRPVEAGRGRLDRRGRRRADRRSSASCSNESTRSGARAASSLRTRREFRSRRSPKAAATTSAAIGSARISSTRRDISGSSRSFRPRPPTPPWSLA